MAPQQTGGGCCVQLEAPLGGVQGGCEKADGKKDCPNAAAGRNQVFQSCPPGACHSFLWCGLCLALLQPCPGRPSSATTAALLTNPCCCQALVLLLACCHLCPVKFQYQIQYCYVQYTSLCCLSRTSNLLSFAGETCSLYPRSTSASFCSFKLSCVSIWKHA